MAKGGTHYGNMFDNKKLLTPDNSSELQSKLASSKNGADNGGIVITNNAKQIPMKIQSKSRVRISTESMNQITSKQQSQQQNYQINQQTKNQKSGSVLRRNSQVTDKEEDSKQQQQQRPSGIDRSGIHIKNIDEFEADQDFGFDPPTKLDSGRGNANSYAGSGYIARGGDFISPPQNQMFDIEEDNEEQVDHHYQ